MRFFTNKGIVQKTVIALVIVILTTFAVPTTVQADVGGKLMSPIVNFVVAIFDAVQHLLEWAMLGETEAFMKTVGSSAYKTSAGDKAPTIEIDEDLNASFFGLNAINVPVINYTPEAIFSNQVPALDVNFISPSVKTGDAEKDPKMNIAMKLQPIIASWYSTLRIIAIVGLLSVLVYLGIRMLLTSVAADRAKYKQMLMDWIVGMCLVVTLHYIMAFAMTMAETVTAMLSSEANGTFTVVATGMDGIGTSTYTTQFSANLMSYVRFMVQAADLNVKIAFMALYIMLVIFSIRFTWIYLKRVVNMAFLTLIAPMVALMYPIDKASDGKAQAFDMWLKEYTYNALIQPVDLLLYKVLLGSAVELAVDNPVYAIVALGFIIAAENLVKKMFGFGKASGGTLGSLAGAAGVSAFAGQMLNNFAKKGSNGGGNGKVRTKDVGERTGKDKDANAGLDGYKDKDIDPNKMVGSGYVPPPDEGQDERSKVLSPEEQAKLEENQRNEEMQQLEQELDGYEDYEIYENPELGEKQIRYQELREQQQQQQQQQEEQQQSEQEPEEKGFFQTVGEDIGAFGQRFSAGLGNVSSNVGGFFTDKDKRAGMLSKAQKGIRKRAIAAWKAAPTALYKGARGTLRGASRLVAAGAMGTMGAIIGATTGDGDKAISMAMGAAGVGLATGDNLFDASPLGQAMPNKSVLDAYDAGIHGNKTDARNARADKAYFRSEKFDDFYEKYYKNGKYSKKQLQDIVQDYRKAGITSESDIRRAIKLEELYKDRDKLDEKTARKQIQQNIQIYKDYGANEKTFSDEKARLKAIQTFEKEVGGKNAKQVAENIFRGLEDWRNSGL